MSSSASKMSESKPKLKEAENDPLKQLELLELSTCCQFGYSYFAPPQAHPLLAEPCQNCNMQTQGRGFPGASRMLMLQNPTGGRVGFENTRKAA